MHAQQIMGTLGRSELVPPDFASAMWVWPSVKPIFWRGGLMRFQSDLICTSTSLFQHIVILIVVALPSSHCNGITLYVSEQQQQGGHQRVLLNQRAQTQAAVRSSRKTLKPLSLRGMYQADFLVRKWDPLYHCRQNIHWKWQFLPWLCADSYLKGRNVCLDCGMHVDRDTLKEKESLI